MESIGVNTKNDTWQMEVKVYKKENYMLELIGFRIIYILKDT